MERMQTERLKKLRAERDNARGHPRRVDALRKAAANAGREPHPAHPRRGEGLATLGEISDAMRDVFGEHQEHVVL